MDGMTNVSNESKMPESLTVKRLYNLKEAAHYLGLSPWGMRDLFWGKKIPAIREGRKIYLDIDDLNDYIRRHKSLYD